MAARSQSARGSASLLNNRPPCRARRLRASSPHRARRCSARASRPSRASLPSLAGWDPPPWAQGRAVAAQSRAPGSATKTSLRLARARPPAEAQEARSASTRLAWGRIASRAQWVRRVNPRRTARRPLSPRGSPPPPTCPLRPASAAASTFPSAVARHRTALRPVPRPARVAQVPAVAAVVAKGTAPTASRWPTRSRSRPSASSLRALPRRRSRLC